MDLRILVRKFKRVGLKEGAQEDIKLALHRDGGFAIRKRDGFETVATSIMETC